MPGDGCIIQYALDPLTQLLRSFSLGRPEQAQHQQYVLQGDVRDRHVTNHRDRMTSERGVPLPAMKFAVKFHGLFRIVVFHRLTKGQMTAQCGLALFNRVNPRRSWSRALASGTSG